MSSLEIRCKPVCPSFPRQIPGKNVIVQWAPLNRILFRGGFFDMSSTRQLCSNVDVQVGDDAQQTPKQCPVYQSRRLASSLLDYRLPLESLNPAQESQLH